MEDFRAKLWNLILGWFSGLSDLQILTNVDIFASALSNNIWAGYFGYTRLYYFFSKENVSRLLISSNIHIVSYIFWDWFAFCQHEQSRDILGVLSVKNKVYWMWNATQCRQYMHKSIGKKMVDVIDWYLHSEWN